LTALAALTPPTAEAAQAIADAQSYFTHHAARMDYPQFVTRHWPIGSGAVEASCKCVVEARLKQAGMRWGVAGAQAMASLRALHRSGRWTAFWQTHPHRQRLESASQPGLRAAAPAARPAVTASPAGPPPVAAHATTPRALSRPKPTLAQRPLILPRSA